jgi:hypothetical protein
MANDTPSTETAAAPVAAAPAPSPAPAAAKPQPKFKVSLERWATKKSGTDKRVALIHGFVHTMKVAKRFRDFAANYDAAYEAYANAPIANRKKTASAATK